MTGRWRGSSQRSGGSSIPPWQDVLDRLDLLPYYRELLGKVLNSVTKKAGMGDGGIEKGDFLWFPSSQPCSARDGVPGPTRHTSLGLGPTFVDLRVRSVTECCSCINPPSKLPLCSSFCSLACCTCSMWARSSFHTCHACQMWAGSGLTQCCYLGLFFTVLYNLYLVLVIKHCM